jgi:predicted nucleotidyltransferase
VNDAAPIPHVDDLRRLATETNGLRLLVLFGSRARGDSHPASDWDFGYLADPAYDVDGLLARLSERLCADRLDLVDLARAGGQLRFRAARDGRVVFARDEDEWERFWLDAVSFWYDAGPVLSEAYDSTLRELRR